MDTRWICLAVLVDGALIRSQAATVMLNLLAYLLSEALYLDAIHNSRKTTATVAYV
jgi:hypothetical protein